MRMGVKRMGTITPEYELLLRAVYRQNKGDEDYGSCLWAIFDIDPENGMLNIQSDCGNYAHRWSDRGRDFLLLLTMITPVSMLYKLVGKPKCVDFEKTIASVKECLHDAYEDDVYVNLDAEFESLESELSEFGSLDSKEVIEHVLETWANERELEIDQIWEYVCTEYSPQEERIVKIFKEHVVPEINRFLYPKLDGEKDDNVEFIVFVRGSYVPAERITWPE